MKRSLFAIGMILVLPSPAAAERDASLGVTGGFAMVDFTGEDTAVDPGGGAGWIGVTVGLDRPPPPLPLARGSTSQVDLVPELSLAYFGGRGAVLGGVRLDLDYAQRQMGLFGNSARGTLYVAARAGFASGGDTPLLGIEVGSHVAIRGDFTLGYWFGLLAWGEEPAYVIQDGPIATRVPAPPDMDAEAVLTLAGGLTLSRAY